MSSSFLSKLGHYGTKNQILNWPENIRRTLSVQCTLGHTAANNYINNHWFRNILNTEESMAEMHKR